MEKYDSIVDTTKHVNRVNELVRLFSMKLMERGAIHDTSKFQSPEKELFDEYTPKLSGCTYGSEQYNEYLKGLKVALDHHYANNSHHSEHHKNGINDMTLFDIVEMFLDWKAASERHNDGNIHKSIEINKKRYNISDQLAQILENTAKAFGFLK